MKPKFRDKAEELADAIEEHSIKTADYVRLSPNPGYKYPPYEASLARLRTAIRAVLPRAARSTRSSKTSKAPQARKR